MYVDEIDLCLLRELDKDVRTSVTQLAKKARIGKETAHYRLRRLEKSIITGYWLQPKLQGSAGAYKLLLKDKCLGVHREELLAFLVGTPGAAWVAETEGVWDIVVSNYATSDAEFVRFVQDLLSRFGSSLRSKAIVKMTRAISLNEKYLHKQSYVRRAEDDFATAPHEIDEKDAQILTMLSRDARASYAQIAASIGITGAAISQRVRKLQLSGAIVDSKIRVNHRLLGLSYFHVMLALEDYGQRDAIINYYAQHPNCVYIMTHLGMYDLHLEIVLEAQRLPAFITELSERFGKALAAYDVLRIVREHRMRIGG
jgi:DNA-binding Lrp family transcriptional regulator